MPCHGPNSCARCQDTGASSAPCCCQCCCSRGLAPLHWGCHLCVLSPEERQPRLASLCWHGCERGPSCFPRTVLPWDKALLFSGGMDKAALTGSANWQHLASAVACEGCKPYSAGAPASPSGPPAFIKRACPRGATTTKPHGGGCALCPMAPIDGRQVHEHWELHGARLLGRSVRLPAPRLTSFLQAEPQCHCSACLETRAASRVCVSVRGARRGPLSPVPHPRWLCSTARCCSHGPPWLRT